MTNRATAESPLGADEARRFEALSHAARLAELGEDGPRTIKRAEAFLAFLQGDAAQKPRLVEVARFGNAVLYAEPRP